MCIYHNDQPSQPQQYGVPTGTLRSWRQPSQHRTQESCAPNKLVVFIHFVLFEQHVCTSVYKCTSTRAPWSAGNGSDRKERGWNLNFREQRGHHLLRIMTQMLERFECTVTYHM